MVTLGAIISPSDRIARPASGLVGRSRDAADQRHLLGDPGFDTVGETDLDPVTEAERLVEHKAQRGDEVGQCRLRRQSDHDRRDGIARRQRGAQLGQ